MMYPKKLLYNLPAIGLLGLLSACQLQPVSGTSSSAQGIENCIGVYYTRDSSGDLHKFNQYWLESAHSCFTDNLPLSRWDNTSEAWLRNNVHCTPQPQFQSRTLVSANNYYQYADGKVYLDLDSSTGVFRRITLAEDRNGQSVFTKLQGCFYQRPSNVYENQLLLDTDVTKIATSEWFDPIEIFTYTTASATSMEMTRFDDVSDWDYRFCPADSIPWGYCDLLRNGNDMFFSTLTNAQQNALTNEAKLIRQMYNYVNTNKNSFESLWANPGNRTEKTRDDYKYQVQSIPDTPQYIWSAWRDYIIGNRPTPPDISGSRSAYTCYEGRRLVSLAGGGSSYILGEVCYDPSSGEYKFTQN
jgi:hypothetical protein